MAAGIVKRRRAGDLRTGEVIDKRWLRFTYPTFWHYDVLRGLDYLRSAGVQADDRVREAVELVMARRHQNGRWPLNLRHPEFVPIEMETEVGRASRWNTLRALRVLRWYEGALVLSGSADRLLTRAAQSGFSDWVDVEDSGAG